MSYPRPDLPAARNRPAKVSELLARDIVAEIASRRARPGDTLPSEASLITRFGVGRGSLREALRILEVEGIITMKTGPGRRRGCGDPRPRRSGPNDVASPSGTPSHLPRVAPRPDEPSSRRWHA